MDDLISRQAVLEATSTTLKITGKENAETVYGYIKKLCDDIKALPSAQQWIPCSERMPKRKDETQMRGYYLTTNAYGSVGLTKYEFEGGCLGYAWGSDIRIVAWMPLPEPYKGEE